MKYASICDGIGAVHCAWRPLGWDCTWTSEIEGFPIAVVEDAWPGTVNLGDMLRITETTLDEHARPDVVVGGTPCQSFSVAGLRGGLADPRGNLAVRFMQLVGVLRPAWVVWENVPGVLSSNGGRDFGSIVGSLVELGYGFAYRVLDAQFFGVPQRRRRVFVVGCSRGWQRAAAVLFEREGMRGNPPTREAAREGTAANAGRGAQIASHELAPCLETTSNDYSRADGFTMVAHTSDSVSPSPRAQSQDPHRADAAAYVMQPYTKAKRAQSASDDETWKDGEVSPTLNHFDIGDTRSTTVVTEAFSIREDAKARNFSATPTDVGLAVQAHQPSVQSHHAQIFVAQPMQVRRLTPRECERLQGFPDDYTLIPWRKKPAEDCPDGPRYRALGNSMAVPVMRWIGERIQAVEAIT